MHSVENEPTIRFNNILWKEQILPAIAEHVAHSNDNESCMINEKLSMKHSSTDMWNFVVFIFVRFFLVNSYWMRMFTQDDNCVNFHNLWSHIWYFSCGRMFGVLLDYVSHERTLSILIRFQTYRSDVDTQIPIPIAQY